MAVAEERISNGGDQANGGRRWRVPAGLEPTAFLLVVALAIAAVFWGAFFSDFRVSVVQYDAGPLTDFEIGKLNAYPDLDLYIVGLPDGRLRALDARIEGGCAAEWLPADRRAAHGNPGGVPGAFVDPCTGAVWSMLGNAISGTNEPLRTPDVRVRPSQETGELRVVVEMINHPAFADD